MLSIFMTVGDFNADIKGFTGKVEKHSIESLNKVPN